MKKAHILLAAALALGLGACSGKSGSAGSPGAATPTPAPGAVGQLELADIVWPDANSVKNVDVSELAQQNYNLVAVQISASAFNSPNKFYYYQMLAKAGEFSIEADASKFSLSNVAPAGSFYEFSATSFVPKTMSFEQGVTLSEGNPFYILADSIGNYRRYYDMNSAEIVDRQPFYYNFMDILYGRYKQARGFYKGSRYVRWYGSVQHTVILQKEANTLVVYFELVSPFQSWRYKLTYSQVAGTATPLFTNEIPPI